MTAAASPGLSPIAIRRRALIGVAIVAMVAAMPDRSEESLQRRVLLRVDPNTAPAAVLEALPRVGPATAGKFLAARGARPFANVDDLDRRVRGIGPATREALTPYLRFDAPTSPATTDR